MKQIQPKQKTNQVVKPQQPVKQQQKGINFQNMGRMGKMTNPALKYNKLELANLDFNKVFTLKERTKFEEMFKYFDRTGQSFIKREDLPFALRAMGFLVTTIEVRELAQFFDPDNTQKISLKQFMTCGYVVQNRKPDQNEIFTSLKVFDRNQTGYIDVVELRQMLMTVGDIVDSTEFDAVFSELDVRNGQVALSDLVELLTIASQF